jgi:hypothetical protein
MSKNELEKIWDNEVGLPYREKVDRLQDHFLSISNNEVEKPDFIEKVEFNENGNKVLHPSWVKYKHRFTKDLYIREMYCPKDRICFSVIHKKSNPLFLLSGKLAISSEDGVKELIGPTYVLTEPGTKRVILVLEDIKVVTVHPNPDGINNLDKIEKQLFACNWEDFEKSE